MNTLVNKRTALVFEQQPRERSLRTATVALPFEQQPKESAKAFAAFRTYLGLGPERSLVAVASKVDKYRSLIERWSRKFDWPGRVQAYMAHLAEAERLAIQGQALEKAVEWHQKHEAVRREAWREAEETIAMVRQAREEWQVKGRLPGWEGMARMLELAFKLKQFAAGMPSEIKETHTHVTGRVSVEWEAAIRKAYGIQENAEMLKGETLKSEVVDVQEVPTERLKAEGGGQRTEAAGSGVPALPGGKP